MFDLIYVAAVSRRGDGAAKACHPLLVRAVYEAAASSSKKQEDQARQSNKHRDTDAHAQSACACVCTLLPSLAVRLLAGLPPYMATYPELQPSRIERDKEAFARSTAQHITVQQPQPSPAQPSAQ